MKNKKTLPNLIRDLFTFFQVKYTNSNSEPYEAYEGGSPDRSQVINLDIPDCPRWASPCLVLKKFGRDSDHIELKLSAIAPDPGYNNDFSRELIEIGCEFERSSTLWIRLGDVIGGIGGVMKFAEEDRVLGTLRLEFINKAHELFYSGVYDTELKTLASV